MPLRFGECAHCLIFAHLLAVCAAHTERVQCPPDDVCLGLHRHLCSHPSFGCGACIRTFREVNGQCEKHSGEYVGVGEQGSLRHEERAKRVERAARPTTAASAQPSAGAEKSQKSKSSKKNDDSDSFNAALVIALSVAAVVCFIFGIIVAFLCLKSMRVNLKETSVAEYPFGLPGRSPISDSAAAKYSSEEQAQLFHFEQRKAQIRSHRPMRGTSPQASGSGEDISTTGEEDTEEGRSLHPGEDHKTLYVSSSQRQTKLKIVNPAFHTERRARVPRHPSSSGYSSASGHTPPAIAATKPAIRSSTL